MARLRSILSILLSLLVSVFLFSVLAQAQQDPATSRGLKPYGTYNGGNIDVVSIDTGKVDLHAPLLSYPQRGALSMNFTIRYWAPSFEVDKDCEPGNPPPPCQFISSASVVGVYVSPDFLQVGTTSRGYTDANGKVIGNVYSVTTPDGGQHELGATSSTIFESVDATGFRWDKTANVVTDKDGVRYSVAPNGTVADNAVEDTNGNEITVVSGGYKDTLGRTIPAVPSIFGASGGTISRCPSGGLTVFEAFDWNVPGPTGSTQTYTFCYIQKALNVNLHVGANSLADTHSPTLLQSIVLPNGQYWNFTYGDNYDNLTQITLPTGGTISYVSGPQQMCFVGGAFPQNYFSGVGTRSINANDGTGSHTWGYSIHTGTLAGNTTVALVNTVTDPMGNQDVITMTPLNNTCSYYETIKQNYQGSSTTGTLLKTITTTYSYTLNVDDNSARKSVVNVVPTTVTATWPSGKTKQTTYSYDSGFAYSGPGGSSTGIYGNRLSQFDSDYGVGSAGPILSETYTNYLAFSNSTYLNLNFLNLVSSQKVTDGNTVQKAYTTYAYDQTTLTPSGVTMQHDSGPPTGSTRGNQTSVSRWLNTTGGYLTTNRVFYDTGMLSTSTDPLIDTTTYDYSSSFYGAYVTETQLPPTPAQHNTFANYDFDTGQITSSTDQNGNITTYNYDPMWRLAQVNHPDGGQDTITYQETTFPFTTTLTTKISSTQNKVETNVFDGLGRVMQHQLNSSQQVIYTNTTYDALGRVAQVYNPTRCNPPTTNCGESTWGYVTTNYDALSRVTSVTKQDGSTSTTSYSAFPCITVTDEAGKARKSCSDGLGRLTQIFEDPSGLNYETDYTYDAIDNLVGVNQKGDGSAPRTRSFQYDSLSRLLSASNPESGTNTYSYDPDGNVITKTDPRGVITTMTYDALNRVLTKSYSDGTPTANFYYDSAPATWANNEQNTNGRLVEVTTGVTPEP